MPLAGAVPVRRYKERSSLAQSLEIVGERWSFLILRDIWLWGPLRFAELQESLGIARNILANRLVTLVSSGVVDRRLYQSRPDRYELFLSERGEDLVPTLLSLTAWGDRHFAGGAEPTPLVRHRDRNHRAEPLTVCRLCGEELTMRNLEPTPGPGAPR